MNIENVITLLKIVYTGVYLFQVLLTAHVVTSKKVSVPIYIGMLTSVIGSTFLLAQIWEIV